MPNKTISLPEEVIPIIASLGVPFSVWVADQLRRHALANSELTFSEQLLQDAQFSERPSEEDSKVTLERMQRNAPW